MAVANIRAPARACKARADDETQILSRVRAVVPFFDELRVRAPYPLDRSRLAAIAASCQSVRPVISKHEVFHESEQRYSRLTYQIVNPSDRGLRLIAKLPPSFMLNCVELALDLITDERTKWRLADLFDAHHVQGWHRQPIKHWPNGGTTTGSRRFFHAWYCDRPSKRTGEHCFHLEARLIGRQVLARHGVDQHHLIDFDDWSFWSRHLDLYTLDKERLGRFHDNRLRGRCRRQPIWESWCNKRVHRFNRDARDGHILFAGAQRTDVNSIQHLVDHYGRGPFLQRIDTRYLMSIWANHCFERNPLDSTTQNASYAA
jgi:hypothetical protein